ncbi:YetF domain-containing protein [Thermoclostridium caenicola]|uniref:Uncharacterized membrane protein YcaP, DUF421 family n=1 Tax=Thermoclostridium caenicola TaxID=659425 RepID=A0A1M6B3W0_9FIRM|nr:DUF421 domain-containing protein [Thermoclostridium caenicola]SHI43395.1 Uncharacterized membrane protein YcaP, DUF421 family [Thermoclostridium caenicola]HOP72514.1 DUF421 domain-containing protein [Thermoclostridium caenicola]HPO76347.1 DUF421 domain-containing protein [Thermoclostridium caenicola]HPU21683.1 DUF421 domain-containing protein [Thermoclostridium caenicola]
MPIILVVTIRSLLAFLILLVLIRIIGKQQVSQLTFFDYVLGITIGSFASTLSVQLNENSLATIWGMVIWALLALLLAFADIHCPWLRKLAEGKPSVVIENGHLRIRNLKRLRITIDELMSQLRIQGVFNISDVEYAIFEPNGQLSVQKKSQKQPLTPADLKLDTQYDGLPANLIVNGRIRQDTLNALKLSRSWLMFQLGRRNIREVERVILAQLDTRGNLFVDLVDDEKPYVIHTREEG